MPKKRDYSERYMRASYESDKGKVAKQRKEGEYGRRLSLDWDLKSWRMVVEF
jgi:hypothetical protein